MAARAQTGNRSGAKFAQFKLVLLGLSSPLCPEPYVNKFARRISRREGMIEP